MSRMDPNRDSISTAMTLLIDSDSDTEVNLGNCICQINNTHVSPFTKFEVLGAFLGSVSSVIGGCLSFVGNDDDAQLAFGMQAFGVVTMVLTSGGYMIRKVREYRSS